MCQITESGHSRHMLPKISNKETHFLKKTFHVPIF